MPNNQIVSASIGDPPLIISVPQLLDKCKVSTVEVTLDDEPLETFSPYVEFDKSAMTVTVDAKDCEFSFEELPLVIKYTDGRGSIQTDLATLSLNLVGCNQNATEKYHHIYRPYFNVTEDEQLTFILEAGQSWIWPIPDALHEDNRTSEHLYTIKVKKNQPIGFLDYFEKT